MCITHKSIKYINIRCEMSCLRFFSSSLFPLVLRLQTSAFEKIYLKQNRNSSSQKRRIHFMHCTNHLFAHEPAAHLIITLSGKSVIKAVKWKSY